MKKVKKFGCLHAILVGVITSTGSFLWASETCEPVGPQKVLILQMTTPNDTTEPISRERISSIFLGNGSAGPSLSVDGYWSAISQNRTFIEKLDIKGPYSVNTTARCGQLGYEYQVVEDVLKASGLSDEKIASFDRLFVVMPNPGCGFAGYSSVGCKNIALPKGGTSSLSLSLLLKPYFEPIAVTHEASHGLGFWHSRTRSFSGKPLGNFDKKGKFTESDPYSLMSSGGRFLGMPSIFQRQSLGFVSSHSIQLIQEESENGIYRIYSRSSQKEGRLLALKIERRPPPSTPQPASSYLWAEYITKEGPFDSQIEANTQGLLLSYQDRRTGREGHLLNFGKGTGFSSAVLRGKWIDPFSSLRIEVLDIQPGYIDVRVWYETVKESLKR